MSLNVGLTSLRERASHDPATELYRWQRALFFRPWYRGADVIEVGSGDGRYLSFAANFAARATGLETDPTLIAEANAKYPATDFQFSDLVNSDYTGADLVLVNEILEFVQEPTPFLNALRTCTGSIVLTSTNRLHADGPLVPSQPGRWSASEFKKLITEAFPGRNIQFLAQTSSWPARVTEGFDSKALYTIAVIGDRPVPTWPSLGIAMPTINAERVRSSVLGFSRFYPGKIQFAVVANGPTPDHLEGMRGLKQDLPELIHLIENKTNIGYGIGSNQGLDWLWQEGWFDLFGVTNDDVLPSIDCVCQMVSAYQELEDAGHKPGVVGPVTNSIHGPQQVDIGTYNSFEEMIDLSCAWHSDKHTMATPTDRVRGLFILMSPDCLSDVGGFDPRFGLGNWEDDDHNLRCRLAGYTLWIIDGAFLHHQGSSTFKQIGLNYDATIQRNLELICEKWGVTQVQDLFTIHTTPENVKLLLPLTAATTVSGHRVKIEGQVVDLVHQATDIEFCAFIYESIQNRPREERLTILNALAEEARAAA